MVPRGSHTRPTASIPGADRGKRHRGPPQSAALPGTAAAGHAPGSPTKAAQNRLWLAASSEADGLTGTYLKKR